MKNSSASFLSKPISFNLRKKFNDQRANKYHYKVAFACRALGPQKFLARHPRVSTY